MSQAQVNVKDAQGIMRHSRASTTQDMYQQVVPESQRKAVQKLTAFVQASKGGAVRVWSKCNQMQPNSEMAGL